MPLSPVSEELKGFFLSKGLHPYPMPMACEFVSGCQCCQGYLCEKNCKNDSTRICLEPALTQYGAQLLDECEILKLEATRKNVTGVVCLWRGRKLTLRGAKFVLAAGALQTPKILLSSVSSEWLNGLANESGLVGKNLMRHLIDLYAIFPKKRYELSGNLKELSFNDLYILNGQKFGAVQSFGPMPHASVITEKMEQDLCNSSFSWSASLFKLIKPVIKTLFARIFSQCIIFAATLEDLPYRDNMVQLVDNRISLKYRISEHDRIRLKTFREELRKIFKPYRFILIKQAENNERIAHICGTCRFGINPEESVLDAYNRAHRLSNLYVVDSSFFPSSGGTTPALTIAANALRVADHIINHWNAS
jgi:choline dehydrogenase-like flavoprotein